MLIEIILALLLGCIIGTFTGLFPGIHINLVGAMLVSLSFSVLYKIPPSYLVVFIVSMSITHTFLDFIPSIFIGCPNYDTALSVLPGHEMLKEGKGHTAVLLTAYGGLGAILLIPILVYPLIIIVKSLYPLIQKAIPFILIIVSLVMIFSERNKKYSFIVYALTGILGLIILNMPSLNEPLLPLLSGLFGASSIIISIKNKTEIPRQTLIDDKPTLEEIRKPLPGALVASVLCGFLPGLGSGQAAILGNTISKTDRKGFLILLGITNTLVMVFSFLSLYTIAKTRTGSAAAINVLTGLPSSKLLILILAVAIISGITSFFLTKRLSKIFSQRINKINYSKISYAVLAILFFLISIISGWLGVLTFVISTLTGIYCITTNIRRTTMMACLLLPTIVIYLV